jgi:hypothetical protein
MDRGAARRPGGRTRRAEELTRDRRGCPIRSRGFAAALDAAARIDELVSPVPPILESLNFDRWSRLFSRQNGQRVNGKIALARTPHPRKCSCSNQPYSAEFVEKMPHSRTKQASLKESGFVAHCDLTLFRERTVVECVRSSDGQTRGKIRDRHLRRCRWELPPYVATPCRRGRRLSDRANRKDL